MNRNIDKKIGRLTVLVLLGAGICHCISHVKAAERPNVVVILTDDQGWGDLSASGNTNLKTPNVDSLRATALVSIASSFVQFVPRRELSS